MKLHTLKDFREELPKNYENIDDLVASVINNKLDDLKLEAIRWIDYIDANLQPIPEVKALGIQDRFIKEKQYKIVLGNTTLTMTQMELLIVKEVLNDWIKQFFNITEGDLK